ncbi:unnamed protein product, partial [Ranitomeya imitator]
MHHTPHDNSTPAHVGTDPATMNFAKCFARRDLVTKKLVKFTEPAESYKAWRATFRNAMRDLDLSNSGLSPGPLEAGQEKIACSNAQIFEKPRSHEGDSGKVSQEADDDETQLPESPEEDQGAEVEYEVVHDIVTDPSWQEDMQSEDSSTQGQGGVAPQQAGRSSVVAADRSLIFKMTTLVTSWKHCSTASAKRQQAVQKLIFLGDKLHNAEELWTVLKEQADLWLTWLNLQPGMVMCDNGRNPVVALSFSKPTWSCRICLSKYTTCVPILESQLQLPPLLPCFSSICSFQLTDCCVMSPRNSILQRLEWICEQKRTVVDYQHQQGSWYSVQTPHIRPQEWTWMSDICTILQNFEDSTKMVSVDDAIISITILLLSVLKQSLLTIKHDSFRVDHDEMEQGTIQCDYTQHSLMSSQRSEEEEEEQEEELFSFAIDGTACTAVIPSVQRGWPEDREEEEASMVSRPLGSSASTLQFYNGILHCRFFSLNIAILYCRFFSLNIASLNCRFFSLNTEIIHCSFFSLNTAILHCQFFNLNTAIFPCRFFNLNIASLHCRFFSLNTAIHCRFFSFNIAILHCRFFSLNTAIHCRFFSFNIAILPCRFFSLNTAILHCWLFSLTTVILYCRFFSLKTAILHCRFFSLNTTILHCRFFSLNIAIFHCRFFSLSTAILHCQIFSLNTAIHCRYFSFNIAILHCRFFSLNTAIHCIGC